MAVTHKNLGKISIQRYTGGKNGNGMYQQIINLIPPHKTYIEPFVGSGRIFKKIKRADKSILNDINPKIASEWWKVHPAGSQDVRVCNDDFFQFAEAWIEDFNNNRTTLLYLDPPYLIETRKSKRKLYEHEFTYMEHKCLLDFINLLDCNVILSGYDNSLYNDILKKWNTHTFQATTQKGLATEKLWYNYPTPTILHDTTYLGDDYRQREKIKLLTKRWIKRFDALDPRVRTSIISQIVNSK